MPNQGWRTFVCDQCGCHWEEATRDCSSHSGDWCFTCGEQCTPCSGRHDATLEIDRFANLVPAEGRLIRILKEGSHLVKGE